MDEDPHFSESKIAAINTFKQFHTAIFSMVVVYNFQKCLSLQISTNCERTLAAYTCEGGLLLELTTYQIQMMVSNKPSSRIYVNFAFCICIVWHIILIKRMCRQLMDSCQPGPYVVSLISPYTNMKSYRKLRHAVERPHSQQSAAYPFPTKICVGPLEILFCIYQRHQLYHKIFRMKLIQSHFDGIIHQYC